MNNDENKSSSIENVQDNEEIVLDNNSNNFSNIQQQEQLQARMRNTNKNQNAVQRLLQRNSNTLGRKVELNHSTSSNIQQNNNQENNIQENEQNTEQQDVNEKILDKLNPANKLKNFGSNAKNAAKQKAKDAGKAVAKGVAKGIKFLATNPATAPAFWVIAGVLILVLFIPVFIGIFNGDSGSGGSSGSKGGMVCNYNVSGNEYSDIKVQLMECDSSSLTPISGEELVDLEKYVLGVAYAENFSNESATKAQFVAARSYALTRRAIVEKDGQRILQMRNCTNDQVYCDPDKGCWSNSSSGGATVHSGVDNSKPYHRAPMAADHAARKWIQDVAGVVLKDSSGNVISTSYCSDYGVCGFCKQGNCMSQNEATKLGNSGYDFNQIIMKQYSGVSNGYTTGSNCTVTMDDIVDTGEVIPSTEAENWKQCDDRWRNIWLGSSSGTNLCSIGCAATSLSIQIARSGVPLSINNLNPGTFVNTVKANGGFTSGGAIYWAQTTSVAPSFQYVGMYTITGSKEEKVRKINEYLSGGKRFAIIGVKPKCCTEEGNYYAGHWVAYAKGVGDTIYNFDPGGVSYSGRAFDDYPDSGNSSYPVWCAVYEIK